MGLISDKLNNRLSEIIGKCFEINRLLDRGVSLLSVRWKLPNVANKVHHSIAHIMIGDLFADSIGDYCEKRDNEVIYPQTPMGNESYEKPLNLFEKLYHYNLELEDLIKDVIDDAVEEGDLSTKKFLDGLLSRLVPYTALSQTLIDLFTAYDNDPFHLQLLDANIDKYITDEYPSA